MWIYRVRRIEATEDEVEVVEQGDPEAKTCKKCGLRFPAIIHYPSGNIFNHTFDSRASKCKTFRRATL